MLSLTPPTSDDADLGQILVVDDNPRNLLAIEAALGESELRVARAESGQRALKLLLEQDFALIVLDVQMPSMGGFETARLIRARPRTRLTPIVFITAHHRDDKDVLQAYQLGAVDFLFKPLVPEVLAAKAAVFVQLQQQRREVARQAELLREHERKEHERRLAEERRSWEQQALQRQVDEERRSAAESARRAAELAELVTELERTKAELTHSNQELADSDRRKDEFLAVLAHELRNPLMPIVSSLELLRLKLPEADPTVVRARDAMGRQVRQLCRLVDDLLDTARIDSGKIELQKAPVDLAEVIREAVAASGPVIEQAKHHLHVELPEGRICIEADSVRLTQVIANLLNNAARYTPPGGEVRVWTTRDADSVSVVVADNGQGIRPDAIDKIFDMFVQEHDGGRGLGIGLTLVRGLVELHGGKVGVASEGLGKGSQFTVTLPIGDVNERATPNELDADTFTPPQQIALVEDNADIRRTVCDLLITWGSKVEVAESGPAGVELVLRLLPDVALVDLGLPELDGCGVVRKIREDRRADGVRLIAMTGHGRPADIERTREAGFDAHLVKPVTPSTLRAALAGPKPTKEHNSVEKKR